MKKRYFKPRDKRLPKGYDSWLEVRLHENSLQQAEHHPDKHNLIPYSIPHTYEYDFRFEHEGKTYILEAKGRFRDSSEARKMIYVREALADWSDNPNIEIVFIFEKSMTPMPFAKKRKDGTKQSHGEWATRNGFRWLCEKRGDLEGISSSKELVEKLSEMNP